MDKILSPWRQSKLLNTLFFSNIFLAFHYSLIVYVNSSLLNNFFDAAQISSLYIVGSIVTTIILLNASKLLERIGLYKFTLYTLIFELISIVGLFVSNSAFLIGVHFLIHHIFISVLYFNMDIYIEKIAPDKEFVGSIRATYLTISNLTIIVAPTIVSFLIIQKYYGYVYMLSAILIVPVFLLLSKFKKIEAGKVKHVNMRETLTEYLCNKNLYNIFIANFLLQLFYAYMIVYMPIYLSNYIGFSWSEIGIIFTIMLLPFILFELPLGEMEDSTFGEKEFLIIGLIIMGLSTIFISFITAKIFWIWATVLFITRIGASFVEISSETYFFKKIKPDQTNLVSFFRASRPLSFVIAPILATITFELLPFQYIFMILGTILIIGTKWAIAIEDTK
ncbi:MAG: MFS transporter [Patescibacteria group bacterium]